MTIKARASARHGNSRATLRVLLLPLLLIPAGCRTIDDDDRYWRRSAHYGAHRHHYAPPPHVHRPLAPPVFVAPRPLPHAPPRPAYIPPRPPERRFEPHHNRPPSHSGSGDRGHRSGWNARPDHKRGR